MSKKAYTLISGRPIGRHPTIYLYKPEIADDDLNPWTPSVEEWDSVHDAFKAVFDYCDHDDYRDEIRVKRSI